MLRNRTFSNSPSSVKSVLSAYARIGAAATAAAASVGCCRNVPKNDPSPHRKTMPARVGNVPKRTTRKSPHRKTMPARVGNVPRNLPKNDHPKMLNVPLEIAINVSQSPRKRSKIRSPSATVALLLPLLCCRWLLLAAAGWSAVGCCCYCCCYFRGCCRNLPKNDPSPHRNTMPGANRKRSKNGPKLAKCLTSLWKSQ